MTERRSVRKGKFRSTPDFAGGREATSRKRSRSARCRKKRIQRLFYNIVWISHPESVAVACQEAIRFQMTNSIREAGNRAEGGCNFRVRNELVDLDHPPLLRAAPASQSGRALLPSRRCGSRFYQLKISLPAVDHQ